MIRTAAFLAASLEEHLICAFVDPASYLTEWARPLLRSPTAHKRH
jgi:hypothetical protein